ncbi:MAG: hypothetical protein ACOYBY_15455 [Dermatophilaceae bacterium]
MPLLSDEFTNQVGPDMLTVLAWRAMWLHAAVTGPGADALASRDFAALTLVATSALGVEVNAVARHLRRFGTASSAAGTVVARLVRAGDLSMDANRVDLPEGDLAWIRAHHQPLPTQPRSHVLTGGRLSGRR